MTQDEFFVCRDDFSDVPRDRRETIWNLRSELVAQPFETRERWLGQSLARIPFVRRLTLLTFRCGNAQFRPGFESAVHPSGAEL